MANANEPRRISQLTKMESSAIDSLIPTGTETTSAAAEKWHMPLDFKNDDDETEEDLGTLRIPISRLCLLSGGKVPAVYLPGYVDEIVTGNMVISDGKYTFTANDGSGKVYSCPASKRATGEVAPVSGKIYIDNEPETGAIQYRYSSADEKFYAMPESLALVDGSGTVVTSEAESRQIDINLGDGSSTARTTASNPLQITEKQLVHAASGVTAGTYGENEETNLRFGDRFICPIVTVDATGHVTGASNQSIRIPRTFASDTVLGLSMTGTSATSIGTASSAGTTSLNEYSAYDHVHDAATLYLGSENSAVSYNPATKRVITTSELLATGLGYVKTLVPDTHNKSLCLYSHYPSDPLYDFSLVSSRNDVIPLVGVSDGEILVDSVIAAGTTNFGTASPWSAAGINIGQDRIRTLLTLNLHPIEHSSYVPSMGLDATLIDSGIDSGNRYLSIAYIPESSYEAYRLLNLEMYGEKFTRDGRTINRDRTCMYIGTQKYGYMSNYTEVIFGMQPIGTSRSYGEIGTSDEVTSIRFIGAPYTTQSQTYTLPLTSPTTTNNVLMAIPDDKYTTGAGGEMMSEMVTRYQLTWSNLGSLMNPEYVFINNNDTGTNDTTLDSDKFSLDVDKVVTSGDLELSIEEGNLYVAGLDDDRLYRMDITIYVNPIDLDKMLPLMEHVTVKIGTQDIGVLDVDLSNPYSQNYSLNVPFIPDNSEDTITFITDDDKNEDYANFKIGISRLCISRVN